MHQLGVEFVTTSDGIRVAELIDLFDKVGFPRRDPHRLKVALANTHRMVWVRATRHNRLARNGQLLAFARATTSDGAMSATIWDVAVSPAWQRSGLGRAIMERLTRRLVEDGIPSISLYTEPQVIELYKKLGFREEPNPHTAKAATLPYGTQQQQQQQQPCLAAVAGGG